jgi:putative transposase
MSAPDRRALVDRDDAILAIVAQCRLLKIARSTLYYPSAPANLDDLAVMRRMEAASGLTVLRIMPNGCGVAAWGLVVNRKRVRRQVRVMGLEAIYQNRTPARVIRITRCIHAC